MTTRASFVSGLRLGVGPGTATFVLGVSFGAAAVSAGWGLVLPVVSSMFTFSGSAQFTLVTTLPTGTAVAAVAAALLINLRYLVMGVALNDSLQGGRLRRAVQAQALVDASFVGAHLGGGRFDIGRLIGMTVVQWLCWVSGTALGVWWRPDPTLLERLGADVVFPAFFLLLALEEVRSVRAAVALVVGGTLSGLAMTVLDPGLALLAATTAPGRRSAGRSDHAGRRRGGPMRAWLAVLAVTVGASLMKAVGPLTLGRRRLPDAARRVVGLMAPALLAGLIVVELGRDGLEGLDAAQLAGVAAAGVAWRFRVPMLAAVLLGAVTAACLRLL